MASTTTVTEKEPQRFPREMPVTLTKTQFKKTPMVVGVMTAKTLVEHFQVPRRDHRKKSGYQREVSTTRVNRLVKELSDGRVELPTAILLNLREYDPKENLIQQDGRAYFLPDSAELYVVDGQHRVEALARLVEAEPDRWSGFEIPFVCMLGASELEEMEQFYIVNSTAKSVRTDLALDLLKQRAESNPEVMRSLVEQGASWKVDAQTLAEELAKTSLWKGRIRFPGQAKENTVIGSAGMVSSLKTLLGTPYFGSIKAPNQVRVLEAYWQGIKKVIPEVFEDPSKYTLQKGTGVMIMHSLLVSVIENVRSKGTSVTEPDSYEAVLRKVLLDLEGDTASGDVARGADFWVAGSSGAAGSFSSNAGRRVLLARLRSGLPALELE
jgi:DGQHR domain-containing protein